MHVNTHEHTNFVRRNTHGNVEAEHHNPDAFDDAQPSDMDSDNAGPLPVPEPEPDNDRDAGASLLPLQRIEHDYLNGLFTMF
jgi:hypothetical protein